MSEQRNKRRRAESSDLEEIHNESTAARGTGYTQNNEAQNLASRLAGHCHLSATVNATGIDGQQHTLPNLPLSGAFSQEASANIANFKDSAYVYFGAIDATPKLDPERHPIGTFRINAKKQRRELLARIDKLEEAEEAEEAERLERAERREKLERRARLQSNQAAQSDQPARPKKPAPKDPCGICYGKHYALDCIHLNMGKNFAKTNRAFRYWCPFHKRPHPMDECKQLHLWADNPDKVHRLLITESANKPAIATNLISWPDIVRYTDTEIPWSAEYSHQKWRDNSYLWSVEQAQGVITSSRGPDPATGCGVFGTLSYQTASGDAPKFQGPRALEQLVAVASQRRNQLNEEAARQQEEDAAMEAVEASFEKIKQAFLEFETAHKGQMDAVEACVEKLKQAFLEYGTACKGRMAAFSSRSALPTNAIKEEAD